MKIIKVFTLRRNLSHSFRNKDFVNKNTFKNINSPSHRVIVTQIYRDILFLETQNQASLVEKKKLTSSRKFEKTAVPNTVTNEAEKN